MTRPHSAPRPVTYSGGIAAWKQCCRQVRRLYEVLDTRLAAVEEEEAAVAAASTGGGGESRATAAQSFVAGHGEVGQPTVLSPGGIVMG